MRRTGSGGNKAAGVGTYQILSAGLLQSLPNQLIVFRTVVLQKRPLQLLFTLLLHDVHRLSCQRIEPRIVHACGYRSGCGIEILHLIRV